MFSAADRAFNTVCADHLRGAGVTIFLPQESDVNEPSIDPTAGSIFVSDTFELLNSDAIVAVLDQESIDAGVACEIGVAFAAGLPVLGLYTDIRQHRSDVGRMYKNLYVLGAIHQSGGAIFNDLESLAVFLCKGSATPSLPERVEIAIPASPNTSAFDNFVDRLESLYVPSWKRVKSLETTFAAAPVNSVLDYGCGTGRAYEDIGKLAPGTKYVGVDASAAMVELARARRPELEWVSSLDEAMGLHPDGYDVILLHFVLHDQPEPAALCRSLVSALRPGGRLHIVDLSTNDLLNTTAELRKMLARPLRCRDGRLGPGFARAVATATNSVERAAYEEVFEVVFPSAPALDEYLFVFNVYGGADLPLGLAPELAGETRRRVRRLLQAIEFPWRDLRAFRVIVLERT